MCLAVPGEIIAIEGKDPMTRTAQVSFWGAIKQASLALLPEATQGDYVLVHAGFAIAILDQQAAHDTLDTIEQLDRDSQRCEASR